MESVMDSVMQTVMEPVGGPAADGAAIPLDAVTPLEMERSVFDSAEICILSSAFAKAWTFVEFDPTLSVLAASERQSELARCLMAILKFGETDPTSLANSGIKLLRRSQRSRGRLERQFHI
jgi:hypothetical protein